MKKILYTLSACLLSAGVTQAAVINASDGEWSDTNTWTTAYLPGATAVDTAILAANDNVSVANDATYATNRVDLIVRAGAALDISADMTVMRSMKIGYNGSEGVTVTQTAGTIDRMDESFALGTDSSSLSTYTISGTSVLDFNGNMTVGSNGLINVVGGHVTISAGNDTNDNFMIETAGALHFQLNAAGVGTIDAAGTFVVDSTHSKLTIDASSYQGAAAIIDLVTFSTNIGTFAASNITVIGVKSWSVGYDADSMFVSLASDGQGDILLIGQDDFDGTETFLSKVNSDPVNRANLVWNAVSRATVAEQAVIDTSVSAGGLIGLNTGDEDGFLESTKTDQFFAMYRGGVTAARTLTYTFDITGSTDLRLSMDWACSGYIEDPLISVTYSIDGAAPVSVFSVGVSTVDWTETMEDGRNVLNGRSAAVMVNGAVAEPLTDQFQTYTPTIAGTGSVLTVTITMGSSVGGPAYGLDNLALYENDFMSYLPQHVAHLDPYTWDKIQRGCFIRYIGDGAYPEEAVEIIAESCTYIHGQNTVEQSSREQFTIPYPKRIYRFAYKNLTKHYDRQDSIFLNVPQWFMHEAGGTPNIKTDYPILNLTNTNTLYAGMNLHEWWVDDMRDTINPNLPGNTIFIDSLNGAMRAGQSGNYDYWGNPIGDGTYYNNDYTENYLKPLLADIRDEFSEEMIVTGNYLNPWFLPDGNYEYVRDYLHCCYIENSERFGDSYTDILNKTIDQVQRVSEDGKMIFYNISPAKPTPAPAMSIEQMRTKASNAMPEFYASLDAAEQDDLAEMYAYFEFKLAMFLLTANEYSYFDYKTTVVGDYGGTRLFRIVPPFPEFQYPLGAPLGAAYQNGNEWTREFQHASVWLDSGTGEAEIIWNSFEVWIAGHGLSGANATKTANPDGDRLNNYEEYIAGLNPNVFDTFGVSNFTVGTSNTFEWNVVSGRLYNVYWSSNLVDGFTQIESNITEGVFIDTERAGDPAGFYKVTVEFED